VAKTDNLSQQK